jgi:glycerol-3-phosphate dehydrogenase
MTQYFAVIGAGHGGKAMAAHLALMGFKVSLYNRTPENIDVIKKRGGIELDGGEGAPHGFGKLALVTSNMADAIKKAEVIMVVLPSSAHAEIAASMAPHLKDKQIVILHPGRTCGALEFSKSSVTAAVRRMSPLLKPRPSSTPPARMVPLRRAFSASRRPCRWRRCLPPARNWC